MILWLSRFWCKDKKARSFVQFPLNICKVLGCGRDGENQVRIHGDEKKIKSLWIKIFDRFIRSFGLPQSRRWTAKCQRVAVEFSWLKTKHSLEILMRKFKPLVKVMKSGRFPSWIELTCSFRKKTFNCILSQGLKQKIHQPKTFVYIWNFRPEAVMEEINHVVTEQYYFEYSEKKLFDFFSKGPTNETLIRALISTSFCPKLFLKAQSSQFRQRRVILRHQLRINMNSNMELNQFFEINSVFRRLSEIWAEDQSEIFPITTSLTCLKHSIEV